MTNAKRIATGVYEYKGFELVKDYSDGYGTAWFIHNIDGTESGLDPESTKREAMEKIDWLTEQWG